MIHIKCPACDQLFETSDKRRKFCSTECRKNNKELKFTCAHCGKEAIDYISRLSRKKYCSKECHIQHQFIDNPISGVEHYNFQGFKHSNTYRKMAFSIHGEICYKCSEKSDLQVHHIDHNHDNNPLDGSNWMVLCFKCHMIHHSEVRALMSEHRMIPCPTCKNNFLPRHKGTKFCSRSCSTIFQHKLKREAHL